MADTVTSANTRLYIMREFLEPYMDKAISTASPMLSRLERTNVSTAGAGAKYIYETIETAIPQGQQSDALGSGAAISYEDATAVVSDQARFELRMQHLKITLLEDLIEQTQSDPKAIIKYSVNEMKKGMLAVREWADTMLHIGANGKITTTTGVDVGGTYVPVTSIHCLAALVGGVFDFLTPGPDPSTPSADAITMTGVNRANKRFLAASGLDSVLSGDWIMRNGSVQTSAACQYGVNDAISDADVDLVDTTQDYAFGNISRASGNDFWKGCVKDVSDYFTMEVLQDAVDEVHARTQLYPTAFYMNPDMQMEFVKEYKDWHSIAPTTKVYDGGFRGIEYTAAGPVITAFVDKKIPAGEIWGVREPTMSIRQTKGPHWRQEGGNPVLLRDKDKAQSYAYIHWLWQLVCRNPAANIRIHTITTA